MLLSSATNDEVFLLVEKDSIGIRSHHFKESSTSLQKYLNTIA